MGKLLELLEGISLPPDIESKVRILDLQFEQMETRIKKLEQEKETLPISENHVAHHLDEPERPEAIRYTTQVMTHPDDPTPDQTAILKLMQPPGNRVNVSTIAQRMNINLTIAQYHLDELQNKDYVHKSTRMGVRGVSPPSSTYTLTRKGVKFLVDHNLAE